MQLTTAVTVTIASNLFARQYTRDVGGSERPQYPTDIGNAHTFLLGYKYTFVFSDGHGAGYTIGIFTNSYGIVTEYSVVQFTDGE